VPLPVFQQACHRSQPASYTTYCPAQPGRCQMDKPALGHTDFGKVKSPLILGFWGRWGGRESMGVPSPRRGDREGIGLELLGWAFVLSIHHLGYQKVPLGRSLRITPSPSSLHDPSNLASSKRGDFIYIYKTLSSFKLLIVCLDYQNHSSALPVAGKPQPWSPPIASSCSPSSQLCSPPKGPTGPHCPALSHGRF
jgi:hypothetical protein